MQELCVIRKEGWFHFKAQLPSFEPRQTDGWWGEWPCPWETARQERTRGHEGTPVPVSPCCSQLTGSSHKRWPRDVRTGEGTAVTFRGPTGPDSWKYWDIIILTWYMVAAHCLCFGYLQIVFPWGKKKSIKKYLNFSFLAKHWETLQ